MIFFKKCWKQILSATSALTQANLLQERASADGFDWPNVEKIFAKIHEEIDEVKMAMADGNSVDILDECGDLLFTCVCLCRHLSVDPHSALRYGNKKFQARFHFMMAQLAKEGKQIGDIGFADLVDIYWEEAKQHAKSSKNIILSNIYSIEQE